ncbi:MAG: hypothetical protein ACFCU5_02455 [Pleurocapsa sp.]
MKIDICAIEPKEVIQEIGVATAGEIVGGKSGVSINAEAFATGEISFAQTGSNVYSFSYKSDRGTYSFSVGLGYGLGYSFNPA